MMIGQSAFLGYDQKQINAIMYLISHIMWKSSHLAADLLWEKDCATQSDRDLWKRATEIRAKSAAKPSVWIVLNW